MSIASDLIASLVRGYHFNEGSGINATNFATGGGYPATLTASDIWVAPGKLGAAAIQGDGGAGGGNVVASDSNLPLGTDPSSIAVWFKCTTDNIFWTICGYGTQDLYQYRGFAIGYIYGSPGQVWASNWGTDSIALGSGYNDGNWHLAVGLYTDTYVAISLDNADFVSLVGPTNTPTGELSICKGPFGVEPVTVDEMLVFNRVITQDEVAYLWNGGAGRELTSGKTRFPLPCRLPL